MISVKLIKADTKTLNMFRLYISIFCFLIAYRSPFLVSGGPEIPSVTKISFDLLTKLEKGENVNILISFVGGTEKALREVSALRTNDRGEKAQAVYKSLLENADKSQAGVESFLATTSRSAESEFKKFWISNQMWVKDADLKTVRNIAEDSQVSNIKEEPVATLMVDTAFAPDGFQPPPPPGSIQWNIQYVQAPEAWEEIGGKGEGVVVGFIDSGVMPTHETLRHNFRGDYGWLDPIQKKLEPYDDAYHGTHVTGIAVGINGIGVAPGAQWAACKACELAVCRTKALLDCGEFFACPTLANGTNQDCSKAPRIVSNSWGGSRDYESVVAAWKSMGIIPVFAIGNGPPSSCGTTDYPGRHPDVIGVGNVNKGNTTDGTTSQKGPTEDKRIKPDLAAPGTDILSGIGNTDKITDTTYYYFSGTSLACPHVTGTIALLLSRDITLTYEQVKDYLFNNTDRENMKIPELDDPIVPTCGTVKNGTLVWPNNHYGYGLVNAFKAVKAQSLAASANITK